MNNPFRIEWLLIEWHHDWIGNDIIHEIHPGRPGIAEIADLYGSNAVTQDAHAGIGRIALQIHSDVHRDIAQELGDAFVGLSGHVEEAIECPDQARSDRALVVRTKRDTDDFKTASVVQLDEFGDQM